MHETREILRGNSLVATSLFGTLFDLDLLDLVNIKFGFCFTSSWPAFPQTPIS